MWEFILTIDDPKQTSKPCQLKAFMLWQPFVLWVTNIEIEIFFFYFSLIIQYRHRYVSIEVKKKHSISLDCQNFATIAMASEYESGHMSLDMPSYCKQDFSRVMGSEFYCL